ncbi:MAG: cell division protein FtsB [Gammaproteobacteria bacterium]|nr:cell division protein FtsB [Gammaproteobacteria bacterium]
MKLVPPLLIVLLIGLSYKLWVDENGIAETWHLKQAVKEQQSDNRRLKARNETMDAEVKDLKEGLEAIEERARNELGMIQKGETFYQIVAE